MASFRRTAADVVICIGLLGISVGLLIFPEQSVSSAKDGLILCLNVIIPSLFPFFVLSSMVIRLGWAEKLGKLLAPIMRPLFNVNGTCASALILGIVGGYPVGAKTVISLYESGKCTKSEAERMLSFCNNSGPAFIFGVVGAGIFGSSKVALLLYLAHIAASILVGIIFREYGSDSSSRDTVLHKETQPEGFALAFVESVTNSFSSALSICGFVIFFSVLIKLLFLSGALTFLADTLGSILSPIGIDSIRIQQLATGIIELTSGVWSLKGVEGDLTASISMAAFMLGWAGLSVHCQVISFTASTGLSVKTYIAGKFLHGIISAVFVMLLSHFISLDTAVPVYLAEQIYSMSLLNFKTAVRISTVSAGCLLLIFGLSTFSSKNSGKSSRKAL